jgi:hypothetical protein
MSGVVQAPVEWIEAVGNLRFPPRADAWLRELMDKNTEGRLSADEREELEALVELSENMALVRAKALQLLGRRPA